MPAVEDKDLGYGAMVKAAIKADGLELRNGFLDHRIRYPRSRSAEGQLVAKVAAILGLHAAISSGYDQERGTIESGMRQLLIDIHNGKGTPADRIQELIGKPIQESQRAAIYRLVHRQTGRMAEAIRSTVFEGGRVGGRGAASKGKVVAGDNPRRPTAREGV